MWMEAGVPGEITASVPGPVVLESPLQRDIVITLGLFDIRAFYICSVLKPNEPNHYQNPLQ